MPPRKKGNQLTVRERKLISGVMSGLSITQAAIKAGYSKKTAQVIGSEAFNRPVVKQCMDNLLDEMGATNRKAAQRISELLDATKFVSCITTPGKDMPDAGPGTVDYVEVPDHAMRRDGVREVCRIRGHYQDKLKIDGKLSIEDALKAIDNPE